MTARRTAPPTREQLLILADRAERGPLSAAEAARLRQGIHTLATERDAAEAMQRIVANRAKAANGMRRRVSRQLAAVRALVTSARQRGLRSVPVWILAATIETAPEIRGEAA
ncbi:hypothetical protein ABZ208_13885 [Streptomyces sp. NPDC006208]|uniref:hypothetical protein n=1 Tax=Streptomyces sp. NPDC006208 TaxID=3156734 RepID=UPI0033A0EC06